MIETEEETGPKEIEKHQCTLPIKENGSWGMSKLMVEKGLEAG